jgi:hypothetical protein
VPFDPKWDRFRHSERLERLIQRCGFSK